jgi:hypothetical protein
MINRWARDRGVPGAGAEKEVDLGHVLRRPIDT